MAGLDPAIDGAIDDIPFEEHLVYNIRMLFREDGVGRQSKESFADSSAFSYEGLEAPSKLSAGSELVLEERIWKELPNVILEMIIKRLPLAAQCRLRCVCRRWKGALPSKPFSMQSRPPCIIMTNLGDRKAKFFCHSEQKWFSVPFSPPELSLLHSSLYPYLQMNWEVADVDAGLVCYQCHVSGKFSLCVCNPVTRSVRVIPSDYPFPSTLGLGLWPYGLKVIVDQKGKTFKVVVVIDKLNLTVVYDSVTACWEVYKSHPQDCGLKRWDEFFVWKNHIYAYNIEKRCWVENFGVTAFAMESGQWTAVSRQRLTQRGIFLVKTLVCSMITCLSLLIRTS